MIADITSQVTQEMQLIVSLNPNPQRRYHGVVPIGKGKVPDEPPTGPSVCLPEVPSSSALSPIVS